MSLLRNAGRTFERIVSKPTPDQWGFCFAIAGFFLFSLSRLADVGVVSILIDGQKKEVGFWSALNWTSTYILLFPIFIAIFGFQIKLIQDWVKHLSSASIIEVDGQSIQYLPLAKWNEKIDRSGIVLILLLSLCLFHGLQDWWTSCGRANYRYLIEGVATLGSEPRDWSVAHVHNLANLPSSDTQSARPDVVSPTWFSFAFSLVAFMYMAITLFLFLAALYYSCVFSLFIYQEYSHVRFQEFDLSADYKQTIETASRLFLYHMFWMSLLGMMVMLMMRFQVYYLSAGSKYLSINALIFEHWDYAWSYISSVSGNVRPPLAPGGGGSANFSEVSSLALGTYSLFSMGFAFYYIIQTIIVIRRGVLRGPPPNRTASTSPSFGGVMTFLTPEWRIFLALLVVLWVAALFPRLGFLFLITCVASLFVGGQRLLRRVTATAAYPFSRK